LRTVKIANEYRKFDANYFKNFINTKKSDFIFDIDNILIIKNSRNLLLSLYIIHLISISNDISANNINPKPLNGIQLINPENNKLIGIYHAHLNDNFILIWYLCWNENGYIIKFEYLIHPPANDNYQSIIKEIYKRNDDGFNLELNDYFINLNNIVNFNINEDVLKFNQYINKILLVKWNPSERF
jgi:hypothetical protein